jgi:hypothetical protein
MAAITWRNVDGGADYRGAALMLRGAQQGLENGIAGFQGILKDRLQLQDENKANTVANNEAEIRRMVNSAGSVDQLKQMQDQGLVQKAMERMGPHGVGRNFDPTQLLRAQQGTLRDSELKDIQYTDAQNKRAADPILQEYQGLLLKDPKAAAAFLTPEREAILRTSNYFDDAAAYADTRGETLKSRDRATTSFNNSQTSFANQQNEVAQRNAERASLRAAARIQQEELAAGGTDREVSDRIMKRLGQKDSGVLPESVPTAMGNTRAFVNSLFTPLASESQDRQDKVAESNLTFQQQLDNKQAQIKANESKISRLSPVITAPDSITPGTLLANLQKNYDINDTGVFSNTLGSDIADAITDAKPLIKEFGLTNITGEHLVDEAARLAAEGSGDPKELSKLSMSKVKELLRTAASSLSTQQKEYNTLQANRAAYTDELQKTQLDALREAARLRRGN